MLTEKTRQMLKKQSSIFEIANSFSDKVEAAPDEDIDFYIMFLAHTFLTVAAKWGRDNEDRNAIIDRLNYMISQMDNETPEVTN